MTFDPYWWGFTQLSKEIEYSNEKLDFMYNFTYSDI